MEVITQPGEYDSRVDPEVRRHGSFGAAATWVDPSPEDIRGRATLMDGLRRMDRI